MTEQARDRFLAGIPLAIATTEKTLGVLKGVLDSFQEEIANFGSAPTMYAGLVDSLGNIQLYDGLLRFRAADGKIVNEGIAAENYHQFIGEATVSDSYLKAPFYKPQGWPQGIYRVGPLGRINTAEAMGTPRADAELNEFRQRFGRVPHSSFLYHYARLVEVLYALERMQVILQEPDALDTHVRAEAGVNALEGVGVIEAPRGTLIHHYKVDEDGAIRWANLIVATGHNNRAISDGVRQVGEHFIKGDRLQEGMLNRVSALVRAYDPCLSCSTHAVGAPAVEINLVNAKGSLLDRLC
jgi:NAD-reducing hydrogenase large subunit